MDLWWKSWSEVKTLASEKDIFLYGRSEDWLPKTINRLPSRPVAIFDRNEGYVGTEYEGIPVWLPDLLEKVVPDKSYIIITSGVYEGIISFLIDKIFLVVDRDRIIPGVN